MKSIAKRSPITLASQGLNWQECLKAALVPGGRWLVTCTRGAQAELGAPGHTLAYADITVRDIQMPAEKN